MPNSLASYDAQNHVTQTNAPGFTLTPPPPIYDGAGDVVNDGTNAYLYDAEGRICAVASNGSATGYLYDAAGNRVAKGSISTMSCDITTNGFVQTAGYVVGPSGEQLTEVDASNNWKHTNVYAGGKQIGTYDGNVSAPTLHFYFDDPLGTRRAQTNAVGLVEATYQSLPFGDGLAQNALTTTDDPTENHFTGKERDTESGNDNFGARYYASTMGRFLSPDWSAKVQPVPYAKLGDPQTLNLYSYVGNNPLVRTDPTGHFDCKGGADFCFKQNMAAFELHAAGNTNSALHDVSKTLGKFGDHNGIVVQEGALDKGTGAVTNRDKSGYSITFNSSATWDINSVAVTLAHEGTHVAQDQREDQMHYDFLGDVWGQLTGHPTDKRMSYEYIRNGEREAYTNQGYMEQYEGVPGEIYAPHQSESQRQGNIERYSNFSAGKDCTDSQTGAMICAP